MTDKDLVKLAAIQAAIVLECLKNGETEIRRPYDFQIQDHYINAANTMLPTIGRFLGLPMLEVL